MHFDEYHNHKWARNLGYARRLLREGRYDAFYSGETLPEGDIYPGMRVMAAYWISVEHEMRLRLATLLKGSGHPEWRDDTGLCTRRDEYVARFFEDMKELVVRESICPAAQIEAMEAARYDLPQGWHKLMNNWQLMTETGLNSPGLPSELIEDWFSTCLRSVANYNRYLIWGAVIAANIYKLSGPEALKAAIDATAEEFKWAISREFYAHVLPAAGFEDVGDVMEVGMRGMYSDQYYESGEDQQIGEATVKISRLRNCELAGVYWRVAEWRGLDRLALGYAICRYCEVHGEATMQIAIPPMVSPTYERLESLGMDGEVCRFRLTLTPADDMERLMRVQALVFETES